MPKVTIVYLNNEEREHNPENVQIQEGMLVMDWKEKRVVINTVNLSWIEINQKKT